MLPRLQIVRRFVFLGIAATALRVVAAEPVGSGIKSPPAEASDSTLGSRVLEAILPKAMQKRPLILFNVFTEMTEEGRQRRQPNPENPQYYLLHTAKFVQTGWLVSAGERPPPVAELDGALRKALAANGYRPVPKPEQRPELLIIFNFGSHGTDPESAIPPGDAAPAVTAGELLPIVVSDPSLFKDVIARATLVAGEKFARELKAVLDKEVENIRTNQTLARNPGNQIKLPVSPEFDSPFQVFMGTGKNSAAVQHLAEMAFHTCYFVIASAYDYEAAEKNEKRLLWRTKMTVEAQGVSLAEIMTPLISNTGSYLGRETNEAAIVKKRINRDGKVEVGTPTVVEEAAPAPSAGQTDRR
jgi:hypothetical protein